MLARKLVRVVVSVVLLAVVGVFSQSTHASVFQTKHNSAAAQAHDLRVLKTDGTDPPPVPPQHNRALAAQTHDLRVLKADGTDPPPVPPHAPLV